MKKKALVSILVAVITATTLFALPTPAATVKLVKNTIIYTDEIEEEIALYAESGYNITSSQALEALIADELLRQGMERDGFTLDDSAKAQLFAAQKEFYESNVGYAFTDEEFQAIVEYNTGMTLEEYKNALSEQYCLQYYIPNMEAEIFSYLVEPTEDDINMFYQANLSSFITSKSVNFSIILIPKMSEADDPSFDAYNRMYLEVLKSAIWQINNGKKTFEEAVAEYSQDQPSRDNNGVVGWVEINSDKYRQLFGDTLYNEIFTLNVGEISKAPVDSPLGYCVIKVNEIKDDEGMLTLDDIIPNGTQTVREYIAEYMYEELYYQVYEAAYGDLISKLNADATINILINGD